MVSEIKRFALLKELVVHKSGAKNTPKYLSRCKNLRERFKIIKATLNILDSIPYYSLTGFTKKELKSMGGIKFNQYVDIALKFLPVAKKSTRKQVKSKNKNKKSNAIIERVTRLFRTFGIIDVKRVGRKIINLTLLGETVRNSLAKFELREDYVLAIYLIAGLLFKTKARPIALVALNYTRADLETIYNELYLKLGKFPQIEKGIEEILDELQLSNAGKDFLTDTQLVLAALDFLGLINLINKREYERSKEGNFITPSVFMGIDFVLNGDDTMGIIPDRNIVGYIPFSSYISEPYKYGKHSGKKIAITFSKALENVLNELKTKSYPISVDLHRRFGRLQKM
jgi:hypothetical protein